MKNKHKATFGIILLLLGVILLGQATGFWDFSIDEFFELAIPIAFIGLGLWLILRKRRQHVQAEFVFHSQSHAHQHDSFASAQANAGTQSAGASTDSAGSRRFESSYQGTETGQYFSDTGKRKYSKVFGDMLVSCQGVNLQNVEVSMFVGDLELNLSGGIFADGLNRIVVSHFIGDLRILFPKDMPLYVHCSNSIGTIDTGGRKTDGIGNSIEFETPSYQGANNRLYIACNSFIGDIKLYSV